MLTGSAVLLVLALAAGSASPAEPSCQSVADRGAVDGIALPRQAGQGCPVFGMVPPGSGLTVGGRAVRVDGNGRFVFGIAREQTGTVEVSLQRPGAEATRHFIEVVPRRFATERVDGVPPATVSPPPEIAARIAREQAMVVAARSRDDARSDFAGGFAWPARGRISGVFGSHRIYNGTPGSAHSGLDVAAGAGTPLRAPAAGIITFAAPDLYLTGGTVLIDHGHGLSSVFLHLSRIDVETGQHVEQGDVFGAVGATGRATGPHMHWGLNWHDVRLDPSGLPGITMP